LVVVPDSLPAGEYTVTVSDNNIAQMDDADLGKPGKKPVNRVPAKYATVGKNNTLRLVVQEGKSEYAVDID